MFNKKKKRILELEHQMKEIQNSDPLNSPNSIAETIQYLIHPSIKTNVSPDATLIYLQNIICKSISYNDMAYLAIRNTKVSSLNLNSSSFIPYNNNFKEYYETIYLNSNEVPLIEFPRDNKKIIDNLYSIGIDNENKLNINRDGISNIYIYPLNIALVGSDGNHRQFSAMVKNELKQIKIDSIYDISQELKRGKNINFSNFRGTSLPRELLDKWYSLMKVGIYLTKYNREIPKEVVNIINH